MPIFKVEPKETKEKKERKKAGIPQEVIDEYKGYIEQLGKMRISEETCQSFRLKLASDSGGNLPVVSV